MRYDLRINLERLVERLETLGQIGAIEGGGVNRLALTDADRDGRDLVVKWMQALNLAVSVDRIGNVVATRRGRNSGTGILIGSHIDTVRTGGRYDGNLGVLAGLEVIRQLDERGIETREPVSVAFFTNEEGARFAPDMMGSMVHQGHLDLDAMLAGVGIDGVELASALEAIGYQGPTPCPAPPPTMYLELHIEQGPVLEEAGITIGAVSGVQGISWTELRFHGQSNHAGTTPMRLRRDAGLAAGRVVAFVRTLAERMGGTQVGTVGSINFEPNLVNVIAREATLTVDLRNTSERDLQAAEREMMAHAQAVADKEGLELHHRSLARFEPVAFDPALVRAVSEHAEALGHSVMTLPSGAGHDAQAFAPNCPAAMIFVPSAGGISHNVTEHTDRIDIEAGATVLLNLTVNLAGPC